MKTLLKNMEAAFVVALGLAGSTSYLLGADERASAVEASARIATESKMAVVEVTGKRMSELEKQQSLREERGMTAMGEQGRTRG
ncbi:MAG: hypothetical protein ABIT83_23355 [Massilia sp.]